MNILEKFFGSNENTDVDDGLTQEEREAIIDLLVYCKFTDNHLSLAEEQVLEEEVDRFSWESSMAVDTYIASSATVRARKAKDNPQAEGSLLEQIGQRLVSDHAKATAKDLMMRLFQSDGETDAEKAFAEKVAPYLR